MMIVLLMGELIKRIVALNLWIFRKLNRIIFAFGLIYYLW